MINDFWEKVYLFCKKNLVIFILLILAINVFMILNYIDKKDIYHPDEIWSYAHSNSSQGAFLAPNIDSFFVDYNNELHYKWFEQKQLKNYVSVQLDERFRYKHIWENLAKDVHPPLYYVILHTISSFFVDGFSKWYAGVINIVAFIVSFFVLFKIAKGIIKDEVIAFVGVSLWAFSYANMGIAMYLRMYMLLLMFFSILMYETLEFIKDKKGIRLFYIFVFSLLSFLVHYNAIISIFCLFFLTSAVFIYRKDFIILWQYCLVFLFACVALWVIVPSIENVLFLSQRGKEMASIYGSVSKLIEKGKGVINFAYVWGGNLFSFNQYLGCGLFVIGIIVSVILCYKNKDKLRADVFVLALWSIGIGIVLAILMPNMGSLNIRYYALVMPFMMMLTIFLIKSVWQMLGLKKEILFFVLFGCFVFNSVFAKHCVGNGDFLFRSRNEDKSYWQKLENKDAFLITRSTVGPFFDALNYTMNSHRVMAVKYLCNEDMINYAVNHNIKYVLVVNEIVFENLDVMPRKYVERCSFFEKNYAYQKTIRGGQTYFDFYELK